MTPKLRQAGATIRRVGRSVGSLWEIFSKGGQADGCTEDQRSPQLIEFPSRRWAVIKPSVWGMSFNRTLTAAAVLGLVLLCSPTWFGVDINSTAADIGHLGGALIVTVSVISMAEVIRTGRVLNIVVAVVVIVGPWMVQPLELFYSGMCSGTGLLVIAFSIPRGQIHESYGHWSEYIW